MNAFSTPGCAQPSRTTRLHAADFQDISAEAALSLRQSDFLRERTPASEPIVIALAKVENLTSDLITEGEKRYLLDRVMDSEMMASLRRERSIRFVIPAEQWAANTERAAWSGPNGEGRQPTHSMTAVLHNVIRAAGADRTDLYAAEYRITEILSGETVWAGEFLLKRAATGRAYN